MDTNATLAALRELVEITKLGDPGGTARVARFVELVDALDEWLSKGGFLPEAWQPEQLWQYKISWTRGALIHNEDFEGTEEEANEHLAKIAQKPRAELRSVRRRRAVEIAGFEEVQIDEGHLRGA